MSTKTEKMLLPLKCTHNTPVGTHSGCCMGACGILIDPRAGDSAQSRILWD